MLRYYLFQLLRAVARLVPRKAAYVLGASIADLFYLFSHRSKPNFRANLQRVFHFQGEKLDCPETEKKIRRLVRENFRNFAYYLVDFFRFSRLEAQHLKNLVEVVGRENVDRALAGGKGAIGVTPHVGNWELGGIVFSLLGYPINAIALSHQNTKLNRLFVNQRALGGVKVISVGNAALQSLRALRRNEVLVIVGDRDVTERGARTDFFGATALIPRGPAVLAIRSGGNIFFGYFIRHSRHRYRVIFNPPIRFDRKASDAEQERQIIRALVKDMEECIVRNLSQWYMYYRIWPEDKF